MTNRIPTSQEIAIALIERVDAYFEAAKRADRSLVRGRLTLGSIEDAAGVTRGVLKRIQEIADGTSCRGFNITTVDRIAVFLDRELARLASETGSVRATHGGECDVHHEQA